METPSVINDLRSDLRASSNESVRESGIRFFKEQVNLHGVRAKEVRNLARRYYVPLKTLPKKEVFELCEHLWMSGYNEEISIACEWIIRKAPEFEATDIHLFERWINLYVSNWATCDTFCNHSVADLIVKYPKLISHLMKWAQSENRWFKRASAVSLIIPARKGLFHDDIFEIALMLLQDSDDMVQKGYGWMLKAAADYDMHRVFDFVLRHKADMPRTALRYSIEKMPSEMKRMAMIK